MFAPHYRERYMRAYGIPVLRPEPLRFIGVSLWCLLGRTAHRTGLWWCRTQRLSHEDID